MLVRLNLPLDCCSVFFSPGLIHVTLEPGLLLWHWCPGFTPGGSQMDVESSELDENLWVASKYCWEKGEIQGKIFVVLSEEKS